MRFYGKGSDQAYLERLSEKYGIAAKVEFCGHVADIRSIWAENQLLVLPSRSEGTPLSLIEAMICARPSVVTDVGGNLEWIDEPATGFIADAPSPRAIGNALERAWSAQDSWEEIGRRAHELAISKLEQAPEETILSLLLDDCLPASSGRLVSPSLEGNRLPCALHPANPGVDFEAGDWCDLTVVRITTRRWVNT